MVGEFQCHVMAVGDWNLPCHGGLSSGGVILIFTHLIKLAQSHAAIM